MRREFQRVALSAFTATILLWAVSCKTPSSSQNQGIESQQQLSETISADKLEEYFALIRRTMTRKAARRFLNDTFAKELTVSPELMKKHGITPVEGKQLRAEFTETHFLYLLISHPEVEKNIREYLDDPDSSVDPDSVTDLEANKILQKKMLSGESFIATFFHLRTSFRSFKRCKIHLPPWPSLLPMQRQDILSQDFFPRLTAANLTNLMSKTPG